jgi:hypothetical protein
MNIDEQNFYLLWDLLDKKKYDLFYETLLITQRYH